MAIHNQQIIYGQITELPTITKNDNGEYVRGNCSVIVAPGNRDIGLKVRKKDLSKVHYTKLPVITGNANLIETMDNMKIGDLVLIKGNLITRNVVKTKTCKKCGTIHKKNGTLTFVNPIHISIERTNLSLEQGECILKENCEISNISTIIGTVCNTPSFAENSKNNLANFQLAIDRKYFIADDNVETKTDYPWVCVHGRDKSEDVVRRCKPGTLVFIDGIIRTRKYPELEIECDNENCDGIIPWKDFTIDIIPYSIEYMANWITDEEILKKENKEVENILSSVIGTDLTNKKGGATNE